MVAASGAGPGGFSYAQAAKSRPTVPPSVPSSSSEKAASANQAPSSNGKALDVDLNKSWAEEVDTSEKERATESSNGIHPEAKATELKSNAVLRAKLDSRTQGSPSGVSSPDLAASATSHDDLSSGPNGSSQTSWEAKSQASEPVVPSEPAWIAERKERQSISHKQTDATTEETTETTPKPPVLHDAPPPAVNPWAKRAEVAKAKPTSQPASKSVQESGSRGSTKENQKPAATTRPAPNGTSAQSNGRNTAPQKSIDSARSTPRYVNETKSVAARSIRADTQHKAVPAFNASSVQDSTSWPTPDSSQEVERKPSLDVKPKEDNADDGEANKPRKKQEWKPVPVVPNIIWQTPGVRDRAPRSAANGEKSSRGGINSRARGGIRGGAHAGTDRTSQPSKPDAAAESTNAAPRDSSRAADRVSAASATPSVRAPSVSSRQGDEATPAKPTTNGALLSDKRGPSEDLQAAVNGTSVGNDDTSVSEPIPSSASFTNESAANGTTQDSAGLASSTPDLRKDSTKEQNFTPPMREQRRSRGRGGKRDVVNGHGAQHAASYGDQGAFAQYNGHGPSMHAPRMGSSFGQFGRGGNRSSGYRTQSLPLDAYYAYGRASNPYIPQSPLMGMPTYQPGMPDMYSYPLSPAPFSPSQDHSNLAAIGHQVDYYFSMDNLIKDMFLRKNMDGQGFVLLDTVAGFKRVMELTQDREVLKAACQFSEVVEIRIGDDGKERLRPVREPSRWILGESERVEAARHNGPKSFEPIHRAPGAFTFHPSQMSARSPHAPTFPGMPFRPADRRSYDYTPFMNALSPQAMYTPEFTPAAFNSELVNGDNFRDQQIKAAGRQSHDQTVTLPSATNGGLDRDPDVFPTEQIQQLTVCVKLSKDDASPYSYNTRTFSHGSIDADIIAASTERGGAAKDQSLLRKETSKTDSAESKKASEGATPNGDTSHNAEDVSVFWIKDNDKPISMLPSDLTPEPYVQLRHKALEQRSHAAAGTCPYDLDVLYQFWSHFLIRNFNHNMYADFKHFANEDATERNNTVGRRNLAKYYEQALNSANQIPTIVAKDYLAFIKVEVQASQEDRPALKALHRSWRDGALNLRNRKRVSDLLDSELRQLLED